MKKQFELTMFFIFLLVQVFAFEAVTLGIEYPKPINNDEILRLFDGGAYGLTDEINVYQETSGMLEKGKFYKVHLLQEAAADGSVYLEFLPSYESGFFLRMSKPAMLHPVELRSFITPDKEEVFFSALGGMNYSTYCAEIYEIRGCEARLLFNRNGDWDPDNISGVFLDDFKIEFVFPQANTKFLLDISEQEDTYHRVHKTPYDAHGNLLSKDGRGVRAQGAGWGSVQPVDYDRDGIYELKFVQDCVGAHTLDVICQYIFILKYRDGEWEQIDHWVTPAEGVKLISMTEIEVEECGCGL